MLLPPAVWTTFPAGWGKLGKATAGRLKACGLKEGMPDLFIFYDGRTHGIELKTPHGGHSPAQIEMAPKLFAAGVNVYTCRSLEEVRGYLIMHKIPMRNHYGIKTPETRCPSQPDASTAQA
jgi:sulfur relay (sulfurtransferase) complex TusBCD TusD component (DsrE family)